MADGANLNHVGCEYGRKVKDMLEAFRQETCCNFVTCREKLNSFDIRLENLEEWRKAMDDKFLKIETRLAWLMGIFATIGSLVGTTLAFLLKHLF